MHSLGVFTHVFVPNLSNKHIIEQFRVFLILFAGGPHPQNIHLSRQRSTSIHFSLKVFVFRMLSITVISQVVAMVVSN
jgi:hypothetical protein